MQEINDILKTIFHYYCGEILNYQVTIFHVELFANLDWGKIIQHKVR